MGVLDGRKWCGDDEEQASVTCEERSWCRMEQIEFEATPKRCSTRAGVVELRE